MAELLIPLVFAIFIWWFATGVLLLLNGMPRTTFAWSILISSGLAIAAFYGLAHTANRASVFNSYCAFSCALLIWGWHELTFLTGWLTGSRKFACTEASGWPRFKQAVAAIIWHELGILVSGVAIIALTWNAANQIGTLTFLVLWVMRISAKLNLYFGVRNLSEEFLPAHLTYMGSYFRKRAMNGFLPFSIAAASLVLAGLMTLAFSAGVTRAESVGYGLVSAMLAMAILEHFLLVLPLPSTALWRWALRGRIPAAAATDL